MIKITQLLIFFQCVFLFAQVPQTLTLGAATSSSATRGPFQRSSSGSSSVYSRAVLLYSSSELTGLTSTSVISQVNFDLGSTNTITASGDAIMKVYMKNSTATDVPAVNTDWSDVINGATLVGTYTFNTSNNFPGSEGFLSFDLDSDFNYSGDALEIAVDWDCSGLTPADPAQPNLLFSGNGSLNWHWSSTTHTSLLYDASSSQPSILDNSDNRKAERVNTQIIYTDPNADITLTLGTGTSASATRGPLQRSDSNSSSVFSRASIFYTATELTDLTSNATISEIKFDLGSTNVITASGTATMNIYMKNSTESEVAALDSNWADVINGATLVGSYTFSTASNFPGVEGFLSFDLDTDFNYTGSGLEVAVDWDCSGLTATDPAQPNLLFSNNGSLNWHWSSTSHASLLYDASSSQPSALDTRKSERVNTAFVYKINSALSLAQSDFSSKFLLTPNPATDYVVLNTNESIDSVALYDILGKSVNTISNGKTIDVSGLNAGIYFIVIKSGDAVAVKRLIKK